MTSGRDTVPLSVTVREAMPPTNERLPETDPSGAVDAMRTKRFPPEGASVALDPKVLLSVETWKFAGAVAVMLDERPAPVTVICVAEEFWDKMELKESGPAGFAVISATDPVSCTVRVVAFALESVMFPPTVPAVPLADNRTKMVVLVRLPPRKVGEVIWRLLK